MNVVRSMRIDHWLSETQKKYPQKTAIIFKGKNWTFTKLNILISETSSFLQNQCKLKIGDRFCFYGLNNPEQIILLFAASKIGAIIFPINWRLANPEIEYQIKNSKPKLIFYDPRFENNLENLNINKLIKKISIKKTIKTKNNLSDERKNKSQVKSLDNNNLPLLLVYTSGTTGKPKGVVYHHRGSYLMSTGSVTAWNMPNKLTFLYTVPMFHCNGWGYPWTAALIHAKVVCCRYIVAKDIYNLIDQHKVTHFGGAPIVMSLIANADDKDKKEINHKVFVLTAGAPPTSAILEKMDNLGFQVMHVYGLTETYGHILQCAWNDEWNKLPKTEKADINSRQGVRYPNTEEVIVADPENYKRVPTDGKTMGEILIRGNVVMKGYYKNKEATETSMKNGWFHSGDLAVVYPDGYIQIKDRSKDIIISGGENISSVEVENVVAKHESVSLVAVVAKPDEKWGETPCAFVELAPGKNATELEIIQFCKENMAGFKRPKHVIFGELPKTSTGKIQKFELRTKAKEL